ncbi:AGE family epimerase/isomerase [Ruania alba]|uniref:Mannose or cellobiose epimerase, N-acyl-D-glucosamine 2-epimerase family n=1 Tax=Ruania alba TaxID=648782 RepID=A0A1H5MGZ3_9MICO|nr:AGE family epimerase/isomerase [Ruania alba]SEE88615.1 Mannose or cellobiose epimerase, N-acyl-D-glucosamine 2-epimerase family [Ruania alba]
MNWLTNAAHTRWLESETDALLDFASGSLVEEGFAYLSTEGVPVPSQGSHLWLTCRMIHCFSLGALLGRPGSATMVDHGLRSLASHFHDDENGGWYAQVGPDGPMDDTKPAYAHAFVILAGASAASAGRPGGKELLEQALTVSLQRFWREDEGMVVESWDRTFSELEDYRGVNANMHTVEAYLAAADVTGDDAWLDRATRITRRVVDDFARKQSWRIPEHFDSDWQPLLDYNMDSPSDPFRPAGATIGHWFEWSRLVLHVRAAWAVRGVAAEDWMLEGAQALFDLGVAEGWDVDGADGFVYTVDFEGKPLVRERMHWVVTEALASAAALYRVTGDANIAAWYQLWWEYAAVHLIDTQHGSWVHELGADNEPSATVWAGKPDAYHAVQATLIPRLPLAPVLAPALAQGMLDTH